MEEETRDKCVVCKKTELGSSVKLYYGKYIDSLGDKLQSTPYKIIASYNILGCIDAHVCDVCLKSEKRDKRNLFLIVFGITFFLFVILFGMGMLCKYFDILNSFVSLIISLGCIGIVYMLVKSICKLIVIFESEKAIMSQLAYDIKTKEEGNQYSWFTERTYEKMR